MKVNLGSGKNYLKDYVNIDINPLWRPDIVADISKVIPPTTVGCAEILANDVLEHIPDLVSAMTNCLAMLSVGGIMDISVPYYLSLGSWQDPTHVRAFNENSWLYYTDWFWYLGWCMYRFELGSIHYILSEYGKSLCDDGSADIAWLLTMPKAVDSMHVILKKIILTEEEKKIAEAYHRVHN